MASEAIIAVSILNQTAIPNRAPAKREAAFDADRAGLPAATAALLSRRQAEDLTYWDVQRVVASQH